MSDTKQYFVENTEDGNSLMHRKPFFQNNYMFKDFGILIWIFYFTMNIVQSAYMLFVFLRL